MTDVQHPQPWLNHYPEGIDWSCELTRQPLMTTSTRPLLSFAIGQQ